MFIDLNIPLPESFNKRYPSSDKDWAPVVRAVLEAKNHGKFSDAVLQVWDKFPNIPGATVSWIGNNPTKPGLESYSSPKKFTILRRISIKISDPSQNYSLTSNNNTLNEYDIVSVIPETEKAFSCACNGSFEAVDLISIDFSCRLPFILKLKTISQAISKGFFFELSYSEAISDSSKRRFWLSNSISLIGASRGSNLVFSSGSPSYFDLRSPYDVTNLFTLAGISASDSKQSLSESPRLCLIHSFDRRFVHKSVAMAQRIIPFDESEETNHLNKKLKLSE
ncbi:Ribonuclease P protein subunit p30 [Smittium mucronatum]|uniref:Ribonuclease P protein subunit p30 n=1 Tax=Smittium mucronatum TaxID=133383 RepID=A0A1R0GUJ8_9FUNG|nr:Ribonuclease P protein subunit p30 [Smittium mucronatum]